MGWVFAIGFALLTLAGLSLSGRCSRMALEIVAAALLIGIVGYGWQGSPDMSGKPAMSSGRGFLIGLH